MPALRDSNLRLLLETAPKGFTPDWVRYEKGKGWQLKTEKPPIGSYDAIRVYLWVGMLHDGDKQKARLLQRFAPMAAQTTEQGPPEKVNIATGKTSGRGQWASPRQCCRFTGRRGPVGATPARRR